MSQEFVANQSLTGRRSSIHKERNYWAYRTGIELTPWSTNEERARFEKRKRELMEQDAKEKGEVKQASEPPKEVENADRKDGGESTVRTTEANPGAGQYDYRPDRQRYSRAAALLERRRHQSATDCSENRTDE